MKKLLIIIFIGFLTGCNETNIESENVDFVVTDKINFHDRFYLNSKDTVLSVHPNDYMRYDVGDTIRFKKDKSGFFKGTLFLR